MDQHRRLKIGICDDNPRDRQALFDLLTQTTALPGMVRDLEVFEDGQLLIQRIQDRGALDLVFLDIYMEHSQGIQVAQVLRNSYPDLPIVFTTNSKDHALEGFQVKALHYILKPVKLPDVEEALSRYLQVAPAPQPLLISIRNKDGVYHVNLDQVLFVESHARVLTLIINDGTERNLYEKLDDFELQWPSTKWLRCHKSFLVNLDQIQSIVGNKIHMKSGQVIPVSISLVQAKARFAEYLAQKAF